MNVMKVIKMEMFQKIGKTLMTMFIILGVLPLAHGSINGELGQFFQHLGYDSNATQAHAYQGQAAGYYSGGSMFMRNQIDDVQLIHIDVPSFTGGCGTIDAYLGGFSFINGKQIITLVKKIMSNSVGYMFDLALTTTVPQLKQAKDYIQRMANKINSLNVNSCQAAQAIVGGLWPKTVASQQKICKDVATQSGVVADWTKARQNCSRVGGQFKKTMNQDNSFSNEKVINKNLIWDSLKSSDYFSQNSLFGSKDTELMELFMSLSGTLIIIDDGNDDGQSNDKPVVRYIPSLMDSQNFLKAFLYGTRGDKDRVKIWKCENTDTCLKVDPIAIAIDATTSLVPRTRAMLLDVVNAVKEDKGLTPAEKSFINMTSVPILKFITVLLSLRMDTQADMVTQYAEVIAEDILSQYLHENLKLIKQALATRDYPAEVQAKLQQKINHAELAIVTFKAQAYRKLQDTMGMIKNIEFLEGQVASNLSSGLEENQ